MRGPSVKINELEIKQLYTKGNEIRITPLEPPIKKYISLMAIYMYIICYCNIIIAITADKFTIQYL